MNVLIITEDDVFYVYEFFKIFLPLAVKRAYTIKAITVCAPFNKRSPFEVAKRMYGFYGPGLFLRMGMTYLMKKFLGHSIRGLAQRYAIPLWDSQSVNSEAYLNRITKNRIDLIVSIDAPQIFKRKLLQSARCGSINSHSALLPENKGMMPVFWGMYKQEPEIGVTIHYITENVDAGDIIRQVRVPVGNESLHDLIIKTKQISARLIDETITDISRNAVTARPMPEGGSYQTFPTRQEAKEFRKRGRKFI